MPVYDHIFPCYNPPETEFVRAEGLYVYTQNNERYLDFIAGIAVNSLGHAHPALVKALSEQAQKIWHLSNMYRIPGQKTLAEKYCNATFAETVFFSNSGTEAIECALKTARRYHYDQGDGQRINIIGMQGSFHGRTFGAINAGGNPQYRKGFGPSPEGFSHVPFNDLDALKAVVNDKTAAVIIEPVQGEGGLQPCDIGTLKSIRKLCDENGALLIYDEVQSGAGRTGRLFAHQWANGEADPDIMAVAKGMGGGFPLGACLASAACGNSMVVGTHGSTYGGNPLAMAVGNAVFDVLTQDGFLDQVVQNSNYMHQQLHALKDNHPDIVTEVRGKGFLCGMKITKSVPEVRNIAFDKHFLLGGAGDNTIRMAPPLIAQQTHIHDAMNILDEVFTQARNLDDV